MYLTTSFVQRVVKYATLEEAGAKKEVVGLDLARRLRLHSYAWVSGDQHFFEIVALYRPPPHQDWGRARTAGNRFARDD